MRGADALAGRDPAAAAFPSFSGAQVHSGARNAHGLSPVAARPSWDDIDPDANDEDDPDAGEDGIDALAGRKLGIDIGAQLPALSPEELRHQGRGPENARRRRGRPSQGKSGDLHLAASAERFRFCNGSTRQRSARKEPLALFI